MNTLNFNDADLKANREGGLSDAQVKRLDSEADRLRKHSKFILWFWLGMYGVVTVLIMINTYTYYGKDLASMLARMTSPGFTIITGIFFIIGLLVAIQYAWEMRALLNEPISAIDAVVEVVIREINEQNTVYALSAHSNWYSWYLFKFDDKESLRYFESGKRYRLYYLNGKSRLLLSAEEIEPEMAKR